MAKRFNVSLIATAGLVLILVLAGCANTSKQTHAPTASVSLPNGSPTPTAPPSAFDERSTPTPGRAEAILASLKPRVAVPDVSGSDLKELVRGNSDFAFKLYQAIKAGDGNLFYSPYSISLALAMTYAGARGDTERQMAETLSFLLPQSRLHPAFNALDLQLASRGQGAKGQDGKAFRLNVANALWGQHDHRFLDQFLDVLQENYGAGMRLVDFKGRPEESRLAINDWIETSTGGRIKELIRKGLIDGYTKLVLTNAIYFNAAWQSQFRKEMTTDGDFYLLDGNMTKVSMMRQTTTFGYGRGPGYQVVELPYEGRQLSMVLLMPDQGRFESIEHGLNDDFLASALKDISDGKFILAMPKFRIDSSFALSDALQKMGMPMAFSEGADFSGMDGDRDLRIAAVVHKAFVSVDESGTEAAAATAVLMSTISAPVGEITLDHPFIFLVRDMETGTILFVGRVMNPGV